MSVLIKGLKMPQSCYMCDMQELSGVVGCGHAYATNNSEWGRALNCPLVELPAHGDLIDESEKVDAQYYDEEFEEWLIKSKTVGDILYDICEVPPKVVIPAERSEDGSEEH